VKILLAESSGFSTAALAALRSVAEVIEADLDRTALLAAVADADVLWVRLRHQIDEQVLSAGPKLKYLVSPTTGLNHLDMAAAKRRNIQVISLRGEVEFLRDIRATAELTVGLLLSLLRRIPPALQDTQAGNWDRDKFQGRELYGKTVGIVGYGRLGRIVARYLQAFDTRVLVTDPELEAPGSEGAALPDGVVAVSLARLLAESDVVTLHVNLCDATEGFFGAAEFAQMKPGAWFINTARGELVDEEAMIAALQTDRLAGVALDVLRDENSQGMARHKLVQLSQSDPRVLITPHIGGCTIESMEKTERHLAERLLSILAANRSAKS